MEPIVSRRHPIKFILALTLLCLFSIGLATSILIQFFEIAHHGTLKPNQKVWPFLSLAFYALAIYSVIKYHKNAPRIRLDDMGISIGQKVFAWQQLQAATLTGKVWFPYLISYQMEGTTLFFKSGEVICLFDEVYQNMGSIKLAIQHKLSRQLGLPEEEPPMPISISYASEFFETFKNNPWWSFRGLSVWLFGIMLIGIHILKPSSRPLEMWLVSAMMFTPWLILHAWLMHYVEVSDTWLVVRNHIWFWKKRTVALSNILEVVFETQPKEAYSLRIIKNFETHRYQAGTLRTKTWRALKLRLEQENIFVRDECVH